jgi:hypothetical protein
MMKLLVNQAYEQMGLRPVSPTQLLTYLVIEALEGEPASQDSQSI